MTMTAVVGRAMVTIAVAPAVIVTMVRVVVAAGGGQHQSNQGEACKATGHVYVLDPQGDVLWRNSDRRLRVWFPKMKFKK